MRGRGTGGFRWRSIAWSAAVVLSIVYLGEHYLVDALDGVLYVAARRFLVELFTRWRARVRTRRRLLRLPHLSA